MKPSTHYFDKDFGIEEKEVIFAIKRKDKGLLLEYEVII